MAMQSSRELNVCHVSVEELIVLIPVLKHSAKIHVRFQITLPISVLITCTGVTNQILIRPSVKDGHVFCSLRCVYLAISVACIEYERLGPYEICRSIPIRIFVVFFVEGL